MRLWTAVFTLHSGHVENGSRARYVVNHQSRNFYSPHNDAWPFGEGIII